MDAQEIVKNDPIVPRPKALDWLWRPRLVKAWWLAIPVYWTIKLGSYWLEPLDFLNEPGWFGYLNILFFPPLVLMILGTAWVRALIDTGYVEIGQYIEPPFYRGPSGLPYYRDPLDPRSGPNWIGNPLNLLNSSRNQRH